MIVGSNENKMKEQKPSLPDKFRDQVAQFPESSMGANRIKIDLADGRRIYDTVVDGIGIIVMIGNKKIQTLEDLDFKTSDIISVTSEI
ncbi:MAG: hypothetical protein A2283_15895 [Lentisphaerae bacterium RIFOXYA12_FULL_48_11]|nr:MAG: hypothetical protein A2283_15895 [Lentisphaerae bacterium RIFOXYA12_FULL_48_11]